MILVDWNVQYPGCYDIDLNAGRFWAPESAWFEGDGTSRRYDKFVSGFQLLNPTSRLNRPGNIKALDVLKRILQDCQHLFDKPVGSLCKLHTAS